MFAGRNRGELRANVAAVGLGVVGALAAAARADPVPGGVPSPGPGGWLEAAARTRLADELGRRGLDPVWAAGAALESRVPTLHNGLTHFYYQQRVEGLELRGGHVGVHLDRSGHVVSVSGGFAAFDPARLPDPADVPTSATDAVRIAAGHVAVPGETPPAAEATLRAVATADEGEGEGRPAASQHRFDLPDLSPQPVVAELVWTRAAGAPAGLALSWEVSIAQPQEHHHWLVTVDATSGTVRDVADRVRRARYGVIDLPGTDPIAAPRTLVEFPSDPVASPFGWHDTDGTSGAEFTDTRGNNALAQDDLDNDDEGGFRPDGGGGLEFEFPLDLGRSLTDNLAASVAQAFYTVNRAHDILYRYGFDEAAGSYQTNNYGRGGIGGDPVYVDVLDGGGVDNAVFTTGNDGVPARLVLYPWLVPASVTVDSPPGLAGSLFRATVASFAGALEQPLRGRVVQALDAADEAGPATTDACSEILNPDELAGNIALIDRGTCLFTDKIQAAQNAGAVAAIIVNHEGDELVNMAGDTGEITIPAFFIGQTDGESLKASLGQSPEVTLTGSWRDSAFDSAIVVHEYAHGLSSRLTGGPGRWSCLNDLVSAGMAEGWSDWFGLVLTTNGSDRPTGRREMGEFLNGSGTRDFPYSTDLAANPETYRNIRGELNIYEIGEVWCSALWEMFWNLVDARGFDDDPATGSGGNNLAVQLVVDAMKLQPCSPTFTEARDAILLADRTNFGGDHQRLIWEAFAKRGIGEGATDDGGDAGSTSITEDFTVPEEFRATLASYSSWAASAFPADAPPAVAQAGADPDRDGTPNLAEFHLGSDPLAAGAPGLAVASGGGSLTVHYERRVGTATLGVVEWSTGGTNWSSHGVRWSVAPAGEGRESVEATLPAEAAGSGGVLVRLRVTGAATPG